MNVNQKYLAALAVLVAVNVVMAGLLYARLLAVAPDPMAPVAGFGAQRVQAPSIPSNDPIQWEEKPPNVGGSAPPTGFSIQSRFNMGAAYAVWGGELRCWLQNTGKQNIFVYGFSIEGSWSAATCATVGMTLEPGVERYLGMLHFSGPASFGNYHFTMKTAVMTPGLPPPFGGSSGQWWYDFGWVGDSVKTIAFLPLGDAPHYTERSNPRYYFDKANRVMTSNDPAVIARASEIAANYSGVYNIYQAAAAFDYVFDNVAYVNDPAGRDYWARPDETLQKMTGDCEDHAFLLAALITAMGGNARFHMEQDHAFLSIYIGVDMNAVQAALEIYYNTPLEVASFHDTSGYWLAADSTASMYLGGLPLGGQPLDSGLGLTSWGLTNTTFHYVVDMMPD